jgi:hypothetical protein
MKCTHPSDTGQSKQVYRDDAEAAISPVDLAVLGNHGEERS